MRKQLSALFVVMVMVGATTVATAHESPNEGHVPANTNYGFEVVG